MTASVWEKRGDKDYCRLHDQAFRLPAEQCTLCKPVDQAEAAADLPVSADLIEDHAWYRAQAEYCMDRVKAIVDRADGIPQDLRDTAGAVRALSDVAFKFRREATKLASLEREWKRTTWLAEQVKERH